MSGLQRIAGNRRQRLLTSYIAGLTYLVVRAGQQLALLPAFLFAWGPGLYEQWILLSAAAAFLGLADLGTRTYLHNKMLLQWEAGDHDGYRRTFQMSIGVMLAAVLFGVLLLALGTLVAAKVGFLDSEFLETSSAAFILLALGVRALLDVPADILGSPHWARREVTRNLALNTIWLSVELLGILCGLLLGLPPVYLALVPLGVRTVFIAYWVIEVMGRYPELRLPPVVPSRSERSELARLGMAYLGLPLAQLASFQGLVMVLAAVSQVPTVVVVFTAIRTISNLLRQILERVAGLTAAELARSYAEKRHVALARVYVAFARLFGGLSGLLIGAAWVYAPSIVPILTAGKVAYEPAVLQLLLIGLMLGLPGLPVALMLHQINRPTPLLLIVIPQILATLALTFILGSRHGAIGAAAAVAIPEAVAGLFCLTAYGAYALPLPIRASIVRMVPISVAAALLSGCIAALTLRLVGSANVIEQILAGGFAWSTAIVLPAFFIMLGSDQRRWLYQTVRRVV